MSARAHANQPDTEGTRGQVRLQEEWIRGRNQGVTITVNLPPTGGNYTASSYAAEAIVRPSTPRLLRLFSINDATVAVSGGEVGELHGLHLALDPTAQDALCREEAGTNRKQYRHTTNTTCSLPE